MLAQGIKCCLLFAAVFVAGCNGAIGGSGERAINDGVAKSLCVVDTPIRRLTRFEYNQTVRDLLGDTSNPADVLPPEEEVAGFNNQAAALTSSDLLIEQYMKVAEGVGARAVLDMNALLPECDPELDGQRHLRAFIHSRFWNAGVPSAFDADRGGASQECVRLGDQRRLSSGRFEDGIQTRHRGWASVALLPLSVPSSGAETPIEGDVVPFTNWEMATKLSYMLWNTMPDAALFAAAEAGELTTQGTDRGAGSMRMLDDDRASGGHSEFPHPVALAHPSRQRDEGHERVPCFRWLASAALDRRNPGIRRARHSRRRWLPSDSADGQLQLHERGAGEHSMATTCSTR